MQVYQAKTPILPLNSVKTKKAVKVKDIKGDWKVKSKLASLGLFPGMPITLINASKKGQLLVSVKGSRIALDRDTGNMIFVGE